MTITTVQRNGRSCAFNGIALAASVMLGLFSMSGCAVSPPQERQPSAVQKALIGTSKADLLRCAGPPLEEIQIGEMTILVYHKDAPAIEQSFMGSKSSVGRLSHSCTARLRLMQDRVDGIEYKSDPTTFEAEDHCDEIFSACNVPP